MKRRVALAIAIAIVVLGAWANLPAPAIAGGARVDRVVVLKRQHRLLLMSGGTTLASFPVALGRGGDGPKVREDDGKTPEGAYFIDYHKPNSAFYRALHVSYPNPADSARARALDNPPSGAIMIHGLPPAFAWVGRMHVVADWTNGCIALSNPEMKQVFTLVPDGTPIELRSD